MGVSLSCGTASCGGPQSTELLCCLRDRKAVQAKAAVSKLSSACNSESALPPGASVIPQVPSPSMRIFGSVPCHRLRSVPRVDSTDPLLRQAFHHRRAYVAATAQAEIEYTFSSPSSLWLFFQEEEFGTALLPPSVLLRPIPSHPPCCAAGDTCCRSLSHSDTVLQVRNQVVASSSWFTTLNGKGTRPAASPRVLHCVL